jgi:Flp pilus assembly protein TadG
MFVFRTAITQYVTALFSVHRTRLAQARTRGDAGASAVELAIITALILAIAAGLLFAIQQFVTTEQGKIHE